MARGKLTPMYEDIEKNAFNNMIGTISDSLFSTGMQITDMELKKKEAQDNSDLDKITKWASDKMFGVEGSEDKGFFNSVLANPDNEVIMDKFKEATQENITLDNIVKELGLSEKIATRWMNEKYQTFSDEATIIMKKAKNDKMHIDSYNQYASEVERTLENDNLGYDEYVQRVGEILDKSGLALYDYSGTLSLDDPVFISATSIDWLSHEGKVLIKEMYESGRFADKGSIMSQLQPMIDKAIAKLPQRSGYEPDEYEGMKDNIQKSVAKAVEAELATQDKALKEDAIAKRANAELEIQEYKSQDIYLSPIEVRDLYSKYGADTNPYLKSYALSAQLQAQNDQERRNQNEMSLFTVLNPEATAEEIWAKGVELGMDKTEMGNLYLTTLCSDQQYSSALLKWNNFILTNPTASAEELNAKMKELNPYGDLRLKNIFDDNVQKLSTQSLQSNPEQIAYYNEFVTFAEDNEEATPEELETKAKKMGLLNGASAVADLVTQMIEERRDDIAFSKGELQDQLKQKEAQERKYVKDINKTLHEDMYLTREGADSVIDRYAEENGIDATSDDWLNLHSSIANSYLEYQDSYVAQEVEQSKTLVDMIVETNKEYIDGALFNMVLKGQMTGTETTIYSRGGVPEEDAFSTIANWEEFGKAFSVKTEFGNLVDSLLPKEATDLQRAMLASELNSRAETKLPKSPYTSRLWYAIMSPDEFSNQQCQELLYEAKPYIDTDAYETYERMINKRTGRVLDRVEEFKTVSDRYIKSYDGDADVKAMLENTYYSKYIDDNVVFQFLKAEDDGELDMEILVKDFYDKSTYRLGSDEVQKMWTATVKGDEYSAKDVYSLKNHLELLENFHNGYYDHILDDGVFQDTVSSLSAKESYATIANQRDVIARRAFDTDKYDSLNKVDKANVDLYIALAIMTNKQTEYAKKVPQSLGLDVSKASNVGYFMPLADGSQVRCCCIDDSGNLYVADGNEKVFVYSSDMYTKIGKSDYLLNPRNANPFVYNVFEAYEDTSSLYTIGYSGQTGREIHPTKTRVKDAKTDMGLKQFLNRSKER